MRSRSIFLVALPILALSLGRAKEASAGGGYFPGAEPTGSTQVSGHRMVLSIAETQTTLWDQISYTGNPASFVWVLPVKGTAEVGVSSDALFNTLEELTPVSFTRPSDGCPPPPSCNGNSSLQGDSPVRPAPWGEIAIAREVVGPYETMQLSSQDPNALMGYLAQGGYSVPADVSPIISAYVAEGYSFVAIKLLPGAGVQSMVPVRVTTQGKSPVLPLRMAAAGAGEVMPITLFVFGDAYVPSNFPWFTIPEDKVVWDWGKSESNYVGLKRDGYSQDSNRGWLVERTRTLPVQTLKIPLCDYLATLGPDLSGYDRGAGTDGFGACFEDIKRLFGSPLAPETSLMRLSAELSKGALTTDLNLAVYTGTALSTLVPDHYTITKSVGEAPACPSDDSCSESTGCACTAGPLAEDASLSRFSAALALGWIILRSRRRSRGAGSLALRCRGRC